MTENISTGKLIRLKEEGELAADYLGELLDIADLDGDIKADVENGRASVEIISEHSSGLDRLVGEDREILDALQEFTRLATQTGAGERLRLMLDTAGLRIERKAEPQDLATEMITYLRATGGVQKLEAMDPFEREVCHDAVAEEGFLSGSEGAGPHRYVVILPAEEDEVEEAETEGSGGEWTASGGLVTPPPRRLVTPPR